MRHPVSTPRCLKQRLSLVPIPSAEGLAQAQVLVVGDAMLDRCWFGGVDRVLPEAPVPVVHVTCEENRLGGAAHVAMNVATLAAQCTLLTVVGDDGAGRSVRDLLQQQGIRAVLGTDAQLQTVVKLQGLLLTRSEEGISLFDDGGHLNLPTQAREVYDVTGAGDTVIGTLAALMAAGIVVSRFGTAAVRRTDLVG